MELTAMKTVIDVLEWAQLKDEASDSMVLTLGIESNDHLRVLAGISDASWTSFLGSWKVGSKEATPAQKSKAGVARGAAFLAATGKSLAVAAVTTLATPGGSVPPTPVAKNVMNKFKLSNVVNQTSDIELVVLDSKDIATAYASYKAVFGTHPPPDQELTVEQLTAVKALVEADAAPYVDFAVWGSHGNRLLRKLKLHGQQFASDGTLIPTEISGPPNHDMWLSSYLCLRTALISWQYVDLGRLDQYATMIGRYVSRYGTVSWLQIYQADVRMRSEQMERIRRRGDEELALATAAGGTHAMSPSRPWDWVWAEAISDQVFWRIELEEPAQLLILRGSRSSPSSGHVAVSQHAPPRQNSGGPAKKARHERTHNVEGNSFKANRGGHRLCDDFNRGQCSPAVRGGFCPKNSSLVHHCSRCLSMEHPVGSCPRTDFPALKPHYSQENKGGKGKSSKGKGKGGKRTWQY